tara:strand:+ start:4163 stop:4339 length:177 start_codon:yes stop_codon:yes gene_type:complete
VFNAVFLLFEENLTQTNQWMNTPVKAFGNKKPIEMLKTSTDMGKISNLIKRLDNGVFC